MKNLNGMLYYTIKETGYYLGLSSQTIYNYIEYSENLKKSGEAPVIPDPTVINNIKHFSQKDLNLIKDAKRHFKSGDFLKFRKDKTSYQILKEENARMASVIQELHGGVR